jgi:MFS family permease
MPADPHDPFAPFRLRDYRLFVALVFVTTLVQQAQTVAIGWDLYERTGSALALGWLGLAQFLPVMLLFLPAGHLADMLDRRWVVVLSLGLWAASNVLLAWIGAAGAPVGWMYAAAAGVGAAQVINRPARDALMPQILPAGLVGRAMAWNSTVFQFASIAAPALAGAMIAATRGATSVYALNVALAAIGMGLVLLIRRYPVLRPVQRRSLGDLLAGVVHVWRTKTILGVITLDLFAVLFGGITALLPMFAKDILHVGPAALGWLSAAPAIGATAMSVIQGMRRPFRRPGMVFVWSVAGFGVAIAVFGLSTWFPLSFAALAVSGALDNVSVVIRATVVALDTPDALRGRVSAVNRVFISSSNELGAFESGVLAALTSPVFTAVFGGVATVVFVVGALRLFPELRRMGSEGRSEVS